MKRLIQFCLVFCFSFLGGLAFAQLSPADQSPLPVAGDLALNMSWKDAWTYLAKTFPGTKLKTVPHGWAGGYAKFAQTPNGIQVPHRAYLPTDEVTEITFSGDSLSLLGWKPGMSNQDLAKLISAKFQCDIKPVGQRPSYLLASLVGDIPGPYFVGALNSDVVIEIGTGAVSVYNRAAIESGP